MITFFVTMMAHCFGRRPVEDYMWVIAFMLGALEIMFGAIVFAEIMK